MSAAKSEVKRVWISFGEHGDCTNEPDWEADELVSSKRFSEDKFYTYYAFRKMENGVDFVLAEDHDRIMAERDELWKRATKFVMPGEMDTGESIEHYIKTLERTIARQAEVIDAAKELVGFINKEGPAMINWERVTRLCEEIEQGDGT